jgi:hypothetical protein
VIMRYDTRLGKYDGKPRSAGVRSTLCLSSQVNTFFLYWMSGASRLDTLVSDSLAFCSKT